MSKRKTRNAKDPRLIDLDHDTRIQELRMIEFSFRHHRWKGRGSSLDWELGHHCGIAEDERLILHCEQQGFLHCILYIHFARCRVRRLKADVIREYELSLVFLDKLVTSLTSRGMLRDAVHMLRCTRNTTLRGHWFMKLGSDERRGQAIRIASEEPWDTSLLEHWFRCAAFDGQIQCFKLILHSTAQAAQRAVWNHLNNPAFLARFIQETCQWRLNTTGNRPGRVTINTDYGKCLQLACQAGVFQGCVAGSPNRSLLKMVVHYNQPDLVRLLYEAGAAVNKHDVFVLSQDPLLNRRCRANRRNSWPSPPPAHKFPAPDDVDAALEIREYLSKKASQVTSLLDLCLWEVSRNVGWGHERTRTVEQLEIPQQLKEKLMWI